MLPDTVVDVSPASPVVVANGSNVSVTAVQDAGSSEDGGDLSKTFTIRIPNGQQGPKKTATAEFHGEHEGKWVKVWTNFKRGKMREFENGTTLQVGDSLVMMVLDHNLTDDDGQVYPKPLNIDAVDDLSLDLYQLICKAVGVIISEANAVPKD